MVENIDLLITKHGFSFQAWDDQYCNGVWACLSPNECLLDDVRESANAGDLDMIPATEYLLSTEWLPIEIGKSFVDALSQLEKRLSTLPTEMLQRESIWSQAVFEALEHLRDKRNESTHYGWLEGKLDALPSTLSYE